MFDANLRYIGKGRTVFAIFAGSVPEGHVLHEYRRDVSALILCQMQTHGHQNPTVRFFTGKNTYVDLSDRESGDVWVQYAGQIDGTNYLNEATKDLAMGVLETIMASTTLLKECYQCEQPTTWLAPDSRCGKCTRYTPEEIRGES